MTYTVVAPRSSWLGMVEVCTIKQAIRAKLAWKGYQNADAIILDANGYIVSTTEQLTALAKNPV